MDRGFDKFEMGRQERSFVSKVRLRVIFETDAPRIPECGPVSIQ